ncbi:MAG: aldo/keto reductase [Oscillospiraceae bacterium]|jgi:predicted aldo/keto reductase-like oxidoreductase|nr:aldo/keto reductase [Oscillospiraceae bacterium]
MAYLGEDVPKLGFGLMRLPTAEGQDPRGGDIDINRTSKLVDMFLGAGFKYFDTAYGYGEGKSEAAVKSCIIDRYPRERALIATKLPAWAGPKSAEEAKAMFWTSLQRTGAGYFDFYLLHNVGTPRTKFFDDYGIWDYVLELRERGLVRHAGFSFHDRADVLDRVLTAHPEMEFVQLQINYGDWDSGTVESRKCYEVAKKHGKPVVIMEPVKGGSLASPAPPAKEIFDAAGTGASYASWAIRFAASLDFNITVLSGMSTEEQMSDNISSMRDFKPLDPSERKVIEDVQRALAAIPSVPCTGCAYCVPECPQNVVIPKIFEAMNRDMVYGDKGAARFNYMWETGFGGKASDCVACAGCERVCPQHIEIIQTLKKAAEMFEPGN